MSKIELKPGDSVLDASCGTGLVTHPIAKTIAPKGQVTGVDLSEKMIEKARFRTKEVGLTNITLQHMDAEDLDFGDNTFDAVICSLGLMYYPNPEKALKEMFRVARPGAEVSALVWGARKECGWASIFPIVDRRVETDVCPLFFQLGTGDALQKAFKDVGFGKIEASRFSSDLYFNDDKDACLAAFWGGAVALANQKFDKKTRQEANREYLEFIQSYKSGEGYTIPGEFVIVSGYKERQLLNILQYL